MPAQASPDLSVIVPAYDAERYIAEALASVLVQIPPETEVIVVDDGSRDGTAAIAEAIGPPVRVVRAPHSGLAATINRAMSEARGALIASIDADDRWLPGKIERSLAVLRADPSTDAVFGFLRQFLSPEMDSERSRFEFDESPMPGLLRGNMIIRRSSWDRVGPMETHLRAGEFVSWYARAIDAGLVMHMIPEVLYERRIHGDNMGVRLREAAREDYLHLVKATLDRRRNAREDLGR